MELNFILFYVCVVESISSLYPLIFVLKLDAKIEMLVLEVESKFMHFKSLQVSFRILRYLERVFILMYEFSNF